MNDPGDREPTIGELEAAYDGRTIGDLEADVTTTGNLEGLTFDDLGGRTYDDLDATWGDAA